MKRAPALLLLTLAAAPAAAYAPRVHELFPERTLKGDPRLSADVLPAPAAADLEAFRAWLDTRFRAHPDAAVRAEYVRRYPAPADFTAAALKHLMQLNERARVSGIDGWDGDGGSAVSLMSRGSSQPDHDGRNRDRAALDAEGKPRLLPDGRAVPADPAILNMGAATGLSSQAHAHYGLVADLSPDPAMLKSDPRRFAVPAGWKGSPVLTFGPAMAQQHYDLAVLAALWNGPGADALGNLVFGHALHYLGDLGNQIHTVQVGNEDFFVQAKFLTWERSLKTLGGYAGELRPFTSVGLDMLTSHHTLNESLNEKRLAEAVAGKPVPESVQGQLVGLLQDEKEYKQDVEMAVAKGLNRAGKNPYFPAITIIAGRLIDYSSREGSEVYRHTAGAAAVRLQRGEIFDKDKDDPDAFLGDMSVPQVKAHLDSMYWLQARAFARVGTTFRLAFSRYRADTTVPDDATRAARAEAYANAFLATRLAELAAQEERLGRYLQDPPPPIAGTVKEPAWLVGPFAVPALVVGLLVVLRRRRAAAEAAEPPAS